MARSQLVDATTRLHQAAAFTCKQRGVGLELPELRWDLCQTCIPGHVVSLVACLCRLLKKEGPIDKPTFTSELLCAYLILMIFYQIYQLPCTWVKGSLQLAQGPRECVVMCVCMQ